MSGAGSAHTHLPAPTSSPAISWLLLMCWEVSFWALSPLPPTWASAPGDRVGDRAAELCCLLGGMAALSGSCQLLITPWMLFWRVKQLSGAPTPSPTSRRAQGLLHAGNSHPTAAPAPGNSVPPRHVLPGDLFALPPSHGARAVPARLLLPAVAEAKGGGNHLRILHAGGLCLVPKHRWAKTAVVGGRKLWRKSGTEIPEVGLM